MIAKPNPPRPSWARIHFAGRRLAAIAAALTAMAIPGLAFATIVTLPASKDNTLYESATGELSNGTGEYLFTGTTQAGLVRRAVLAFDVSSAIPAGSTINSVTLQLRVSRASNNTLRVTSLHRLTADWGEGNSPREMVRGIRGAKQFAGYRGAPPTDVAALEDALLRVSHLAAALPEIVEMDLNPLRARAEGEGVEVLDARIAVRTPTNEGGRP